MQNNFDLKKFLIENKLTTNSKLIQEAYVSPEGNLEDFLGTPSSGNSKFDKAFDNLLQLASDSYGNGPDVIDGLENLIELARDYKRQIEGSGDSIDTVIDPTSELNIAFLNTAKSTNQDSLDALQMISDRATELWRMYLPDSKDQDSAETTSSESSESYYSPEDLEAATDKADLKFMQKYNRKEAEAENAVKGGSVIWNLSNKRVPASKFKEILSNSSGKDLYYYYCEPGEVIGADKISQQEAFKIVRAMESDGKGMPGRLIHGIDFEIFAV